jgi:hypothetical protein
MKVLLAYARLYGECFERTFSGLRKNTWTLVLPVPLFLAWLFLGGLMAPLGMVGGILLALAFDALASCYLYFTGEIVAHSRVTLAEFQQSIRAYFWSVLNVTFVLWVARLVLNLVLRGNPKAGFAYGAVALAALVMLNALPEVIYARGTFGGLATLQRTIAFMQQNWIEWLVPNVAIGAVLYFVWTWVFRPDPIGLVLGSVLMAAIFHVAMVFRGHLFLALDGSSHRQRMFRYRWP